MVKNVEEESFNEESDVETLSGSDSDADAVTGADSDADAVTGADSDADAVTIADSDADAVIGANSDVEIQAEDDNHFESSTATEEVKETPNEAKIKLETITRNEGVVGSHTGARSKKRTPIGVEGVTETSTGVENVAEECAQAKKNKNKKKSKKTSKRPTYTDEYEDDDDFSYYNEDWTPDNPFQTGTLIHPDEPFYKRNVVENSEVQQKPEPEKYPTFKQFYEDALAEVKKMDKSITNYFEKENNLERARFVLDLSASNSLKLPPLRSGKVEEEAEYYEEAFNILEEQQREEMINILDKEVGMQSLISISRSIRFSSGYSSKILARRYAKRAEFLFSWKNYEEAFRDARRSLATFDEPGDMMWIPYDTLGFCYQEYEFWEKSIYCFKKAVEGMKLSGLPIEQQAEYARRYGYEIKNMKEFREKAEKENAKLEKDLQEKEKDNKAVDNKKKFKQDNKKGKIDIEKDKSNEKKNPEKKEDKQEEEDKEVKSNLFAFGIGHKVELPKPTNRAGTQIGNAAKDSPLVHIKYKSGNGKGLYASADIEPGDIILVEKPYASALHAPFRDGHCCICFKRVFNPIPCSYCVNVWFCGEECMSKSVVRHIHEYECEVLHYLEDPDIENMTLLTYRIITRFPWQKLKQYLPAINTSRSDLAESFEQFNKIDNQHKEVNQKINTEIFLMKTNGKYREFDDLFKKSMASVYILECLKIGGYFKDDPPTNEQKVKIVSIALKHMQALNCYAQNVNIYMPNEKSSDGVGFTIYPMISMTNHSCVPNASTYYINNVCVLRSIRYIKKGQQIFGCYGPYYDIVPKEERLPYLSKYYQFECKCEACVGNWPMFNDNSKPLKFRCPEDKCTEIIKITLNNWGNGCPLHGCETKKIFSLISDVNKGIQFIEDAYENSRNRRVDMTLLKEFQILIDKIAILPARSFSLCQGSFKLDFLEEGNVYRTLGELLCRSTSM